MASSPDLKQYVDLTIYDDDPVSLLNEILAAARGLLPNWRPEAGQIETVLAEAFALRSASVANSINRVPAATTEALLKLFGHNRSDGVKATATVQITFTDSDTIERSLPAGTEFLHVDSVTGVAYTFTLDSTFTLLGSLSGTTSVTAVSVGSAYNLSASGRSLSLLSSASFVESVVFTSAVSGGRDAETDQEYFDRGINLLASYTSATTTANQIKYYVGANKTYANRVEVYNRRRYRDRDTTATDYGTHDGTVLVAVASTVSNPASASDQITVPASSLSDLYSSLRDRTPSGLIIDVMSAELAQIDVTASIVKKDGFGGGDVLTSVQNSLKAYFNPNTWDWSTNIVRYNEVISLIDSVTGVDYVSSLTLDGITLLGASNIGYYSASGGSKASGTFTLSGVQDGTYSAGQLGFYQVDADVATPVVYEYVNTGSITVSSGSGTGTFEAVSNGVDYNDQNNNGRVIANPGTFYGTGTVANPLGTATVPALVGGSDDINTFTPLTGAGGISEDIIIRNLGTLLTYGALNITVS